MAAVAMSSRQGQFVFCRNRLTPVYDRLSRWVGGGRMPMHPADYSIVLRHG
jgi:hypothetical protein